MLQIDDSLLKPDAPLGRGMRYEHTCSKGDRPLVVTRVKNGWLWFCQRCREGGFQDVMGSDPVKAMAHIKNLKLEPELSQVVVQLPDDFTNEIPIKGLAWLYQYGITDKEMSDNNMGYSQYYNRLIMPVYWNGDLVYWQGRNLGEITRENPKYYNVKEFGRADLYFFVRTGGLGLKSFFRTDSVIVVEDIISAIKVGRYNDTVSLLSAHVTDDLIIRLSKVYGKIMLWLDPDKRIEMMKWVQRYKGLGYDIGYVRSSRDPKYYNQLKEVE